MRKAKCMNVHFGQHGKELSLGKKNLSKISSSKKACNIA